MAERETSLRHFINGPGGRAVTVAFLVAVLAVAGYSAWSFFRADPTTASVQNPMFVDVETGKGFRQKISADLKVPCQSPDTGKLTGYPAELCYWTKDGQAKAEPTPVALNETTGKSGPTFCPDCGRLVVHHNPAPGPGVRVPPTRADYDQRHGG